jgi:hypothetical protein
MKDRVLDWKEILEGIINKAAYGAVDWIQLIQECFAQLSDCEILNVDCSPCRELIKQCVQYVSGVCSVQRQTCKIADVLNASYTAWNKGSASSTGTTTLLSKRYKKRRYPRHNRIISSRFITSTRVTSIHFAVQEKKQCCSNSSSFVTPCSWRQLFRFWIVTCIPQFS